MSIEFDDLCGCPICGKRPLISEPSEKYHSRWWKIYCIDPEPTDDLPLGSYCANHYCFTTGETYQEAARRWNNRSKT